MFDSSPTRRCCVSGKQACSPHTPHSRVPPRLSPAASRALVATAPVAPLPPVVRYVRRSTPVRSSGGVRVCWVAWRGARQIRDPIRAREVNQSNKGTDMGLARPLPPPFPATWRALGPRAGKGDCPLSKVQAHTDNSVAHVEPRRAGRLFFFRRPGCDHHASAAKRTLNGTGTPAKSVDKAPNMRGITSRGLPVRRELRPKQESHTPAAPSTCLLTSMTPRSFKQRETRGTRASELIRQDKQGSLSTTHEGGLGQWASIFLSC